MNLATLITWPLPFGGTIHRAVTGFERIRLINYCQLSETIFFKSFKMHVALRMHEGDIPQPLGSTTFTQAEYEKKATNDKKTCNTNPSLCAGFVFKYYSYFSATK